MTPQPAQSPAASSSVLWAQASKEWVIPAKPKPGRKPKKDQPPMNETKETDSKGRRVQNRAAQRAFRERKQSQLAELQARVQSYEQGEIERNVALQQISKRLKEENEQLRTENISLKADIARLKEHVANNSVTISSLPTHRDKSDRSKIQKRWREDSSYSNSPNDTSIIQEPAVRKRFRPGTESPRQSATPIPQYNHTNTYAPSSPSIASSPDSNGASRSPFSPLSFVPSPPVSGSSQAGPSYSTSSVFSGPSGGALKSFDAFGNAPAFDTFDCGLCTENTPCVCRELAMQSAGSLSGISALSGFGNDYLVTQDRSATLKVEDPETRDASSISNIIEIPPASDTSNSSGKSSPPETSGSYQDRIHVRSDALSEHSVSSNGLYQIRLPSPEPAPSPSKVTISRSVPLRLKDRRRSASGKIWQINPMVPICSGDPSNCPACKDDDFGKAFCRALGDSASIVAPACASCPNSEACGKTARSVGISGPSSSSASSPMSTRGGPKVIELSGAGLEQEPLQSREKPSDGLPSAPTTAVTTSSASLSDGKPPMPSERIPANEAWARLKSHPNIAFADLSMLADVVARRTKCSGPVAVIHPAPGSITPERDAARSPAVPESRATETSVNPETKDSNGNAIHLTDPHAHFRAQEQQRAQISSAGPTDEQIRSSVLSGPRPTISSALSLGPRASGRPVLVPQEELRECGRRRIREVDAAGVREALRILDARFDKHS
ncbi:hypothetical protein ACEPAI_658 [Sanghuangporus weigelae]